MSEARALVDEFRDVVHQAVSNELLCRGDTLSFGPLRYRDYGVMGGEHQYGLFIIDSAGFHEERAVRQTVVRTVPGETESLLREIAVPSIRWQWAGALTTQRMLESLDELRATVAFARSPHLEPVAMRMLRADTPEEVSRRRTWMENELAEAEAQRLAQVESRRRATRLRNEGSRANVLKHLRPPSDRG